MYQLRCAASLSAFGSQLKLALKRAAASPATGVLIDTRYMVKPIDFSASAIRHLRKHLEELGLVLAVTSFPTRRGFADRRDLEARVEAVRGAMSFARALGTDVVTLGIGPIPSDEVNEAGRNDRDLLVEVLNDLARHGNHVGAIPVIDVAASDLEKFKGLLDDVDAGPIGVDFNPAAWSGRGINPVETFRELFDVVHHRSLSLLTRYSRIRRIISTTRYTGMPIAKRTITAPAMILNSWCCGLVQSTRKSVRSS